MQAEGIVGREKRRYKLTTDSRDTKRIVAENSGVPEILCNLTLWAT